MNKNRGPMSKSTEPQRPIEPIDYFYCANCGVTIRGESRRAHEEYHARSIREWMKRKARREARADGRDG